MKWIKKKIDRGPLGKTIDETLYDDPNGTFIKRERFKREQKDYGSREFTDVSGWEQRHLDLEANFLTRNGVSAEEWFAREQKRNEFYENTANALGVKDEFGIKNREREILNILTSIFDQNAKFTTTQALGFIDDYLVNNEEMSVSLQKWINNHRQQIAETFSSAVDKKDYNSATTSQDFLNALYDDANASIVKDVRKRMTGESPSFEGTLEEAEKPAETQPEQTSAPSPTPILQGGSLEDYIKQGEALRDQYVFEQNNEARGETWAQIETLVKRVQKEHKKRGLQEFAQKAMYANKGGSIERIIANIKNSLKSMQTNQVMVDGIAALTGGKGNALDSEQANETSPLQHVDDLVNSIDVETTELNARAAEDLAPSAPNEEYEVPKQKKSVDEYLAEFKSRVEAGGLNDEKIEGLMGLVQRAQKDWTQKKIPAKIAGLLGLKKQAGDAKPLYQLPAKTLLPRIREELERIAKNVVEETKQEEPKKKTANKPTRGRKARQETSSEDFVDLANMLKERESGDRGEIIEILERFRKDLGKGVVGLRQVGKALGLKLDSRVNAKDAEEAIAEYVEQNGAGALLDDSNEEEQKQDAQDVVEATQEAADEVLEETLESVEEEVQREIEPELTEESQNEEGSLDWYVQEAKKGFYRLYENSDEKIGRFFKLADEVQKKHKVAGLKEWAKQVFGRSSWESGAKVRKGMRSVLNDLALEQFKFKHIQELGGGGGYENESPEDRFESDSLQQTVQATFPAPNETESLVGDEDDDEREVDYYRNRETKEERAEFADEDKRIEKEAAAEEQDESAPNDVSFVLSDPANFNSVPITDLSEEELERLVGVEPNEATPEISTTVSKETETPVEATLSGDEPKEDETETETEIEPAVKEEFDVPDGQTILDANAGTSFVSASEYGGNPSLRPDSFENASPNEGERRWILNDEQRKQYEKNKPNETPRKDYRVGKKDLESAINGKFPIPLFDGSEVLRDNYKTQDGWARHKNGKTTPLPTGNVPQKDWLTPFKNENGYVDANRSFRYVDREAGGRTYRITPVDGKGVKNRMFFTRNDDGSLNWFQYGKGGKVYELPSFVDEEATKTAVFPPEDFGEADGNGVYPFEFDRTDEPAAVEIENEAEGENEDKKENSSEEFIQPIEVAEEQPTEEFVEPKEEQKTVVEPAAVEQSENASASTPTPTSQPSGSGGGFKPPVPPVPAPSSPAPGDENGDDSANKNEDAEPEYAELRFDPITKEPYLTPGIVTEKVKKMYEWRRKHWERDFQFWQEQQGYSPTFSPDDKQAAGSNGVPDDIASQYAFIAPKAKRTKHGKVERNTRNDELLHPDDLESLGYGGYLGFKADDDWISQEIVPDFQKLGTKPYGQYLDKELLNVKNAREVFSAYEDYSEIERLYAKFPGASLDFLISAAKEFEINVPNVIWGRHFYQTIGQDPLKENNKLKQAAMDAKYRAALFTNRNKQELINERNLEERKLQAKFDKKAMPQHPFAKALRGFRFPSPIVSFVDRKLSKTKRGAYNADWFGIKDPTAEQKYESDVKRTREAAEEIEKNKDADGSVKVENLSKEAAELYKASQRNDFNKYWQTYLAATPPGGGNGGVGGLNADDFWTRASSKVPFILVGLVIFDALRRLTRSFIKLNEQVVGVAEKFAVYNGETALAARWNRGKEFQRNLIEGEALAKSRVELMKAWNDLKDAAQPLIIAFKNLANYILIILDKIATSAVSVIPTKPGIGQIGATAAGGLTGAAVGAAVGSVVAPGVGTVVGGLTGTVLGTTGTAATLNAIEKAAKNKDEEKKPKELLVAILAFLESYFLSKKFRGDLPKPPMPPVSSEDTTPTDGEPKGKKPGGLNRTKNWFKKRPAFKGRGFKPGVGGAVGALGLGAILDFAAPAPNELFATDSETGEFIPLTEYAKRKEQRERIKNDPLHGIDGISGPRSHWNVQQTYTPLAEINERLERIEKNTSKTAENTKQTAENTEKENEKPGGMLNEPFFNWIKEQGKEYFVKSDDAKQVDQRDFARPFGWSEEQGEGNYGRWAGEKGFVTVGKGAGIK